MKLKDQIRGWTYFLTGKLTHFSKVKEGTVFTDINYNDYFVKIGDDEVFCVDTTRQIVADFVLGNFAKIGTNRLSYVVVPEQSVQERYVCQ